MDSSTRNADNLLISMKLEYNKTRQSIITRELTELASSY
jgi:F0F1-type ATP synthase gamma subunit